MNSLNVFHKLIYTLSKFECLNSYNLELLLEAQESDLENLVSFELMIDNNCASILQEILKEEFYG